MKYASILLLFLVMFSCKKEKETKVEEISFFTDDTRHFQMGFTTWPYAPTLQAVNDTYSFIGANTDVYEEMLSQKVPWQAWMNNTDLPQAFTDEVNRCVNRRIPGKKLVLSVSILSIFRDDLAPDYDGSTPPYTSFSDTAIEEAYYKHLSYLIQTIQPDYLIYGMEINELYVHNRSQWEGLKLLMNHIRQRIKTAYPDLPLSESFTLHALYQSGLSDATDYEQEVFEHVNQDDFVSVSFYPFFKKWNTREEWQQALDFLHAHVQKPIVFSETGHISADLQIQAYNFSLNGSETEQNEFLQTLLLNAQQHSYEFVIWWTHRDYYQTWLTFPPETRDLGRFWLTTGLLKDDGSYREAYDSWKEVYKKNYRP